MELIEKVLGNAHDVKWQEIMATAQVIDEFELDQWDAQKNRLRKATKTGTILAVSLDRDQFLRDGDILQWNEYTRVAVIARVSLCEVMMVSLEPLALRSLDEIMETSMRLGHALGNQHWPAVVRGKHIFVPLSVARKVVESVMATHRFKDISYRFVAGEEIMDMLEPHEARRLFGGTEKPFHGGGHSHAVEYDEHPHTHPHTHPHEHPHEQKHGCCHGKHDHGHSDGGQCCHGHHKNQDHSQAPH